jgi:DNA gyrase subunit A
MDELNRMENPENRQEARIISVDLDKEMKKSFLEYSMSVIISRALPDARDGLKPVHRRILYTMYENGLTPDKPYRKCADTVGSVLGRYHPHGDASVYDALVRMAQDFSLRYPLIDGHGNFGSIDGHPAAAYRYTEARMSKMSLDMLADIEKDTVDFQNNYDDRLKEPVVLPSRFPNLLVNGSTGIAVGMATNIPPHNLSEIIDAICLLIDNADADMHEIMEYVKGPDFPTGGIIMGHAGIRAAYATGKGKITVRARAEIEEYQNGRYRIIITEIPYQVNKLNLVKSIVELSDEKRIDGITDVVDHSSREGMRVVIELRRDVNPQVVLNQLYSYTQMQTTFGVIMLALVDGVPRVLTLKQMLEEYIRFQCEVITRRTRFDLKKAQERAHIWEALKIACDFIDEVISIIRSSRDVPTAKTRLMERFSFDELQADAIVKMRLGQLSGLEREKIENELNELLALIEELKSILADENKVREIVKEDCLKLKDKFGDQRRTEISPVSGEVDIEDLIPLEETVITMTRFGYIKRQSLDVYKAQHRGGRGITGITTRAEDIVENMFICLSHDYIIFFTSKGKAYRMKCFEVPEGSRTSKGANIVNLLPLDSGEKITAMLRVSEYDEDKYVCMVTRRGIIKRTWLNSFSNVRKTGIIAVDLAEGDELAWVQMTDGYQTLIVGTRKGKAIRFDENDVRVMGRTARGVRAIALERDDEVIGMSVCDESKYLLTVSETGFGRLSEFGDYRIQSRGGKGLINYHTEQFGCVAAIKTVDLNDDVILIASDGVIIRMAASEIRLCRRPSKGVIVMRLDEEARVVSLVTTPKEDDEQPEGEKLQPQRCDDDEEGETDNNETAKTEEPDEEI